MRKGHRAFTVTRHPKVNKSQAINSLLFVKMIAKLEKTPSNAYQDKHKTALFQITVECISYICISDKYYFLHLKRRSIYLYEDQPM